MADLPDWYWTLIAADRLHGADVKWLETLEGSSWRWRALIARAAEAEAEQTHERRRQSQAEHNKWRQQQGVGPMRA